MEDGGNINAIYFKVPKSRGIVFYLKGNSRSIKGWGKFAKDFLSNGYDFIMMDYRGFGKSKGHRNQTTYLMTHNSCIRGSKNRILNIKLYSTEDLWGQG
ncbi:MAG: alpha/beta fold hydrolase [Saprospiraceae bacterium]